MKKVTLTVVVRDEDEGNALARQMEKSPIAQEGIFTLTCGDVQDLTEEERDEVESQVPPEILEDI
jgi:hypothetical protein